MEVAHRICLEVDKCFVVVNVVSSFLYHLLSHTLKSKNCNTKISCKAVLPLGKAYILLQRYCKSNCLCVATCGLVCNEYPVHKLAKSYLTCWPSLLTSINSVRSLRFIPMHVFNCQNIQSGLVHLVGSSLFRQ